MNDDERKVAASYEEKIAIQKKKTNTAHFIIAVAISTLLLSADTTRADLSPNGLFAFIEVAIALAVFTALVVLFIDGVETFVDSFCFSYYGKRSKFNTAVLSAVACLIAYFVGSFLR